MVSLYQIECSFGLVTYRELVIGEGMCVNISCIDAYDMW